MALPSGKSAPGRTQVARLRGWKAGTRKQEEGQGAEPRDQRDREKLRERERSRKEALQAMVGSGEALFYFLFVSDSKCKGTPLEGFNQGHEPA